MKRLDTADKLNGRQVYAIDVGSSFNSAGFENQLMGAPRMWGFRLKYRFGD